VVAMGIFLQQMGEMKKWFGGLSILEIWDPGRWTFVPVPSLTDPSVVNQNSLQPLYICI
jgi:hypothetical protein